LYGRRSCVLRVPLSDDRCSLSFSEVALALIGAPGDHPLDRFSPGHSTFVVQGQAHPHTLASSCRVYLIFLPAPLEHYGASTMASKPILSSVSTLEQVKDALGKEVEVRDFVGAVDELPTCHLLPKIFGEHLHQLETAEQVYSSYFRGSKLGSTLEMQAVPPYLLPLLWVRCFYGSLPQILLLFTYTPQLDMIHNILAGPALGTAEFTGSTTHAR
jgi:hypothetical protein